MESLLQDLRLGVRSLIKSPGFTTAAVLTLSLGIGLNAAIFSVVNGVLLRPLPFAAPDRLVQVGHLHVERGVSYGAFSPQDFEDLRAGVQGFERLADYSYFPGLSGMNLVGDGEPARIATAMVSADFFPTLGAAPLLGRWPSAGEDVPGANQVLVLSHRLWQTRFGGDPKIIGRTVGVDQQRFTVIGVMPPAFPFPAREVDAWAPLSLVTEDMVPHRRGVRWLYVIGRLRPEATPAAALASAGGVLQRLEREYPESNEGWGAAAMRPLEEALVGKVRQALLVMLGAVGMVLLIACANVANLQLARGLARSREVAIRIALGAGRWRLARQLLTESLLLAVLGGGLGLLWGLWATDALLALSGGSIPRLEEIRPDRWVLGFTAALSLGCGVLFGTLPALRASGAGPSSVLKESGRQLTATRAHHFTRNSLVVLQTALAVVLLTGAGLLGRSFWRLIHADAGVATEQVLTLRLTVSDTKYPDYQKAAAYREEVVRRLGALPGVVAVGGSKQGALRGGGEGYGFSIEGRAGREADFTPPAGAFIVTPNYFKALGIPLLEGRDFNERDGRGDPPGVIINRAAARNYWPEADPLGSMLLAGKIRLPIIGVVGDVRNEGLATEPRPAVYVPVAAFHRSTMNVFIRTTGNPLDLAAAVRRTIRDLDPDQPITDLGTLQESVGQTVTQPRFFAALLLIFGGLALTLAALGVYGLLSYAVSLRVHEFGIRMALGARPVEVARLVLGQSARIVGLGLALGALSALAVSRVLSSILFEVSPTDPLVLLAGFGVIALTALLASYLPASRATRVDPMVALRSE